MSTRQTDAYRHTSLYEQIMKHGIKEGSLSETSSDAEVQAYHDILRAEGKLHGHVEKLIGDDLSDEDIDNLWAMWAGEDGPDPDSIMPGWWDDKPHQIAYRLVLRLTRAEARVAELEAKETP